MVDAIDISSHETAVSKGDLLGWFNMGSTVILVLPHASGEWTDELYTGSTVRMGQAIGSYTVEAL